MQNWPVIANPGLARACAVIRMVTPATMRDTPAFASLFAPSSGPARRFTLDTRKTNNMSTYEQKRAELHRAALEYHEFPTPGKIAIAPTKQLINQRDLALA